MNSFEVFWGYHVQAGGDWEVGLIPTLCGHRGDRRRVPELKMATTIIIGLITIGRRVAVLWKINRCSFIEWLDASECEVLYETA